MAEQSPDPRSRIVLRTERDEFGVPLADLVWHLDDRDKASMARTQELVRQTLDRHGHQVLGSQPKRGSRAPVTLGGGDHHMGTTRMHESPKEGVVDPDGRVHGLANLFVAGSSVFPTVGYANPTLTIVALSLRLADHLKSI
jgi:choline dehydrogenase-like flavoprotein